MSFAVGTEVVARRNRWSVVFTEQLGEQTLVRLRGLRPPLIGQELDILVPFESVESVVHDLRPELPGPLANWLVYHEAFVLQQALGASAFVAVQPGRLIVEPYQLVPVLRALEMGRPRLLLADDVGLGKTVQAGLVLTELVARRIAHRILVVTPAGPLLGQWKTEMLERFGLRLTEIDRQQLEEVRRSAELGANPFDHLPLGIASIDFLKQERVLGWLERAAYDVVIIDEAHHCADVGGVASREDSQRRRLAEVLSRRCDSLLLLTATPHDGNDRSFASLCELLDPALLDGRGSLRGDRYRRHVVRRLKRHVPGRFRERQVIPIGVRSDRRSHAAFLEMQRALLDLIAPELRRAFRARRFDDVLAYIALLKRSVSTVAACGATLSVVAQRFEVELRDRAGAQEESRQRLRTLRDYQRKLQRFGTLSEEEEEERHLLETEEIVSQLANLERDVRRGANQLRRSASVVNALEELVALAEGAKDADPKIDRILAEIRHIRAAEPGANVLIYTEYVTSQIAVAQALVAANIGRVLTMSGQDDDATRKRVTGRFRSEDDLILVSTDAAAEGLNLHDRCHHLMHVELPFNPTRLEQRNGRIDRYGQQLDPVVRYLYLCGTFEERILLRLIGKYERIRSRLSFVPNTLGLGTGSSPVEDRLLGGLLDADERLFEDDPQPVLDLQGEPSAPSDAATRDLLEEIDASLRGFERAAQTHSWLADTGLGAEPEALRDAESARTTGASISDVGLKEFVSRAVALDGGQVQAAPASAVLELGLPVSWAMVAEGMPGYDPGSRVLRLTSDVQLTEDANARPVDFLGRAHPIVRHALARVQGLALGQSAGTQGDVRVSAVAGPARALVLTYLCRLTTAAGPELERVLAVRIDDAGSRMAMIDASQWLPEVRSAQGVRPTGCWTQHFASWAPDHLPHADQVARNHFDQVVADHARAADIANHRECEDLQDWLRRRSDDITGAGEASHHDRQTDLFAAAPQGDKVVPAWQPLDDPRQRLAAFAVDVAQPHERRTEAEGVLSLYERRVASLAARRQRHAPEVVRLGMLMVVPEDRRAA